MSVGDTIAKEFPAFTYFLELKRSGKRELFVEGCNQGYNSVNDYCQAHFRTLLSESHAQIIAFVQSRMQPSAASQWHLAPEQYAGDIGFCTGAFGALIDNYQYHLLDNDSLCDLVKRTLGSLRTIDTFDLDFFSNRLENLSRKDIPETSMKKRKMLLLLSKQEMTLNYAHHRLHL